jgi:hypothetical protein
VTHEEHRLSKLGGTCAILRNRSAHRGYSILATSLDVGTSP